MDKRVIDVACGSKMFWFDKNNPDVEFCDNRTVPYHKYYPNRYIEINPDTVCDFTSLPFEDGKFKLVVFDPPHLTRVGDTSWTALKYGCLKGDWKEMLRKGFSECFRVLDPDGVLIFKWSEVQIPLRDILPLSPYPPLFGHRSGKHMNTHWLCFMKPKADAEKVEGIIIETCLRCGADLLASVIYTYPPINRMDCSSCGWHWESGTKPIERVLFGRKEAADGETD